MALVAGLTIEEFENLPDALALNHELVDGELVDVSGNSWAHNRLRDYLIASLRELVERRKLGEIVSEQEFDFRGDAHGPDVSFVSTGKLPSLDVKMRVQRFVPDLAIEIVSKHDRFADLRKKAERYRECGTKEVWIFSIESREAYLYSKKRRAILDENEEFRSDLIPGFCVRIGDLFDRI